MTTFDELRAELEASAKTLMPSVDISRFYADALERRREQLATLDALLRDRARLRATVAWLQEMAAGAYRYARQWRDTYNACGPYDDPDDPFPHSTFLAAAARTQRDAAALSRLAREALGIEEP